MFRLVLATGLRRGGALALHWPDADFDAGPLGVRRTLSRTSRGMQLHEPETDESRRTVPLPQPAVEALRDHRTRQLGEQRRAAEVCGRTVWSSPPRSAPLELRNVLRRFELLAERAGLRGVWM